MKLLVVAAALSLAPRFALAQDTRDPKWDPWLGCWELVLDSRREGPPGDLKASRRDSPSASASAPHVCVQPAPGGATFITTVGTQPPLEQAVFADGVDHSVTDGACEGTRRSDWFRNGLGLVMQAALSCSGEPDARRISGLSLFGRGGTWIDIQSVEVGGRQTIGVRRYRRTEENRLLAGRAFTLSFDDVLEASGKTSPAVLETALVETGSTFTLSSKRLIALQKAGVPPNVTDVMVALSYPNHFVVERRDDVDRLPPVFLGGDPFLAGSAFGYPFWPDEVGFYSPFFGYSPFFYSPFAYSYRGGYLFGGTTFVTFDDEIGGLSRPNQGGGSARAVNGLGYTRIYTRGSAEGNVSSVFASSAATGSSSGAASPSDAGSSSSGSSSSGSTVSSEGFSSGSSGGTGRTAQPR